MPSSFSVIYIASTGRSGSTILELLLNTMDEIWSMGEIYTLPWEIQKNGKCGCGKRINACAFWAPILEGAKDIMDRHNYLSMFREHPFGGRFVRPLHLLNIMLRSKLFVKDNIHAFCDANQVLFSQIANRTKLLQGDTKYLIDASKDFYRLDWLCRCNKIKLRVIHIVRDPRAYVYSNLKGYEKGSLSRMLRGVKMSLKYVIENSIIEHIISRMPKERLYFIRYEDLATSPEKLIHNICSWLNISNNQERITMFRENVNHAIAGNITRHLKSGVAVDDEWKMRLEPCIKRIATFFSRPQLKRYSYPITKYD